MKRILKGFILVTLSLVLLVGLGLSLVPDRARAALHDASQSALGVPASLGGVDASFGGSQIHLGLVDFDIHNPAGFEGAHLLHLGAVTCDLNAVSLLSGTVAVGELSVEGLRLRIVQDGSRSNLTPLLMKIAEAIRTPGAPEPDPEGPTEEPSSGPRLKLSQLTLRGIGIDLELRGFGAMDLQKSATLPDWTLPLDELRSGDGGDPTLDDLLGHLLQQIHGRALVEVEKYVPSELMPLLRGASTEDVIRNGLSDELKKVLPEGSIDRLEDQAKDKLRGLLDDR